MSKMVRVATIEIWAVWVPQNNQKGKSGPWAFVHYKPTGPFNIEIQIK